MQNYQTQITSKAPQNKLWEQRKDFKATRGISAAMLHVHIPVPFDRKEFPSSASPQLLPHPLTVRLLLLLLILIIVLGVGLRFVRGLVEQHVLPAAEAELEHVLLLQFVVALGLDALVVEEGAVPRAQVDDVGPHPAAHGAVSSGVLHQPATETLLSHQRHCKRAAKAAETETVLCGEVGFHRDWRTAYN